MKAILATIIFTLLVCENIQAGEYYYVDGRAYYVSHPIMDNWHQAFRHCRQLGMHLIDIRTEAENDRVLGIMESYRETHNSGVGINVWISATDLGSEGNFYWMTTGRDVEFTSWADGEPDNWQNNENCAEIRGWTLKWMDTECELERSFICRDVCDLPTSNPECIM